jgi:hypothetical protein
MLSPSLVSVCHDSGKTSDFPFHNLSGLCCACSKAPVCMRSRDRTHALAVSASAGLMIYSLFYRRSSVFIGPPTGFALERLRDAKRFTREPQRDEPATPGKNYIARSGMQRLNCSYGPKTFSLWSDILGCRFMKGTCSPSRALSLLRTRDGSYPINGCNCRRRIHLTCSRSGPSG